MALSEHEQQHALRLAKATAVSIFYRKRPVDIWFGALSSLPLTSTDQDWLLVDEAREVDFRLFCRLQLGRLQEGGDE